MGTRIDDYHPPIYLLIYFVLIVSILSLIVTSVSKDNPPAPPRPCSSFRDYQISYVPARCLKYWRENE